MQSSLEQQYQLGCKYYTGNGVAKDIKKAAELWETAAKTGFLSKGHAGAQYELGLCYLNGMGVLKDLTRAKKLFKLSANQGDAGAQFKLGWCYERGSGVARDLKKAAGYYQLAANQGHADAQFTIGLFYLYGEGVARDLKKAAEYYQLAANQGHSDGQVNLGRCYEEGLGVAKDLKKAVEYYQLAANQGNGIGQYNLGRCYENGWEVAKDLKKAAEYYQLAAKQENPGAIDDLKRLLKAHPELTAQSAANVSKPSVTTAKVQNPSGSVNAATPVSAGTKEQEQQKTSKQDEEIAKLRAQVAELQLAQASPKSPGGSDLNLKISYKIDYNTVTLGKKLGQGGFGVVYQGTWRHTDVAVKQLLTDNLSADASQEFETEVQVMARLRSPNIVTFYGYCLSPKYSIVMEYMPQGSLFTTLHNKQPLNWTTRIRMVQDIARGLAFLHHEKVLHRDIKSLNVLLDEQGKAKLTDFGLSKAKSETRVSTASKDSVGTLAWMAPELFKRKVLYTFKSDVYSLGMTFWEIAARKVPFADAGNPALIPAWVEKGEREDMPPDCPAKLASLIEVCWEGDPNKRPEAETIVDFLESDKATYAEFLPGYMAAKASSAINQSLMGNLHSAGAAAGAGANLSFVNNLASGK